MNGLAAQYYTLVVAFTGAYAVLSNARKLVWALKLDDDDADTLFFGMWVAIGPGLVES